MTTVISARRQSIFLPPAVQAEVDAGALFVVNHSGGKDSQAMLILLRRVIPRDQLLVIHADLQGEEWDGTEEHVRATSLGLPVIIARAQDREGNLVLLTDIVRRRGKFASATMRWCTSDTKRGPINREIRRYLKDHPEFNGRVVSCQGLRAQESVARSKAKEWEFDAGESTKEKYNAATGRMERQRTQFIWHPILAMSEAEVFATIEGARQKPLWVYAAGMRRASCQFCFFACKADLKRAAELAPERYVARVRLEREIGFTMAMDKTPLDQIVGIPVDDELPLAA